MILYACTTKHQVSLNTDCLIWPIYIQQFVPKLCIECKGSCPYDKYHLHCTYVRTCTMCMYIPNLYTCDRLHLLQALLGTLKTLPARTAQPKERRGCTHCLCYILLIILAGTYLCVLGIFLVSVATEGECGVVHVAVE